MIVQVDAEGATYAMWIIVESTKNLDPKVRFFEKQTTALVGGAWAPGWHVGAKMGYASTLDVHYDSFNAMTKAELGALLTTKLPAGTKVSVHADGFNTRDGAHNIHRNGSVGDGAVVIAPETPEQTYLLSHSMVRSSDDLKLWRGPRVMLSVRGPWLRRRRRRRRRRR